MQVLDCCHRRRLNLKPEACRESHRPQHPQVILTEAQLRVADSPDYTALKVLAEKGYPDELIDAVAGHAEFLNHPRTTPLAKTLFAVDELSGFVAACALVRPTGIVGLTPKSVKKKLKQPSFAAAVDRDQMRRAADELGVDFDPHLQRVIDAMEARKDELGLGPREGAPDPA